MQTTAQGIGHTITLLRVRAAIPQKDLAHARGMTANDLSRIEHGHREPSLRVLRKFQTYLQVPRGAY